MNTMFPPIARRSSNPRCTGGVASGGDTTMDERRAKEITGRGPTDTAAAATVVMAALGDRLGLFKQLAQAGPATSGELARRAGLSERYVREWLSGMRAAGYLEFSDAEDRFWLPADHVPTDRKSTRLNSSHLGI